MKGPRPAHVDVGLVERLEHLDEVGAFPLREDGGAGGGAETRDRR